MSLTTTSSDMNCEHTSSESKSTQVDAQSDDRDWLFADVKIGDAFITEKKVHFG